MAKKTIKPDVENAADSQGPDENEMLDMHQKHFQKIQKAMASDPMLDTALKTMSHHPHLPDAIHGKLPQITKKIESIADLKKARAQLKGDE